MNTLILYESIYGSTKEYAHWLAKRFDPVMVSTSAESPPLDDFDAIIFGYPVYMDIVMPQVKEYIQQHQSQLQTKRIGLFVVCLDGPMSFINGKLHGSFQYLQDALKLFETPLIHAAAFPGEINPSKLSPEHEKALFHFYKNILKRPVDAIPYRTGIIKSFAWEFAETFLRKTQLYEK